MEYIRSLTKIFIIAVLTFIIGCQIVEAKTKRAFFIGISDYGNIDEEPIYKKKNLYSELLSDSNQDEGIKEILNTWTKENEEENDSLIETGMPMMFSGTKTIPRYSDDYNNMETIIFK